jgi:hypothetical protein
MKVISGQSPYSGYMSWDKEVAGDLMGGKREGENPIPRRPPMAQSIPMRRFLQALFGDRNMAARAAETGRAILVARSLRRTEGEGRGGVPANPAVFAPAGPRPVWRRPRPHRGGPTPGSEDRICGKTRALAFAFGDPHRGRAIPCGLVCYSSKTIAARG